MKTKYIEANRAILEHNNRVYRRFAASAKHGLAQQWQEKIHTGDFHNIIDPARTAVLEAEYTALTSRTYRLPESKAERRALLTLASEDGFEFVIRRSGAFEVFKNEEDMSNRVREIVKADRSCPVNGKLRVGNGDNLHWFI